MATNKFSNISTDPRLHQPRIKIIQGLILNSEDITFLLKDFKKIQRLKLIVTMWGLILDKEYIQYEKTHANSKRG